MLNKVILIGRLTRDPEMRYTPNANIPVLRFTLAVDRRYKKADGERDTDFIDIVCWRTLAETCHKYLKKGLLIAVCGSLHIRSYDDTHGNRRKAAEVVAAEVRFLEWAKDGQGDRPAGESLDELSREWDAAGADDEDNDLPF